MFMLELADTTKFRGTIVNSPEDSLKNTLRESKAEYEFVLKVAMFDSVAARVPRNSFRRMFSHSHVLKSVHFSWCNNTNEKRHID